MKTVDKWDPPEPKYMKQNRMLKAKMSKLNPITEKLNIREDLNNGKAKKSR